MSRSYQLPVHVIQGLNGRPGFAGPPGRNGRDGAIGLEGSQGQHGRDGSNGKDGLNGVITERIVVDNTALEETEAELEQAIKELTDRLVKIEKKRPEQLYLGGGGDPNPVKELTLTFDNGASVLPTGQANIFYTCPYDATITGWAITGSPSGSVAIDVWKAYQSIPTISNTISGGNYIILSSSQINGSNNLTGWNQSVRNGDIFEFNINSAATLTRAVLVLKLLKR